MRPTVLASVRLVDEARILEAGVVLPGIVARMVDAAILAFVAIADVERRHAQMLDEGRIVRAGTQRADREILRRVRRLLGLFLLALRIGTMRVERVGAQLRARAFGHAHMRLGIGHVARGLVDEMLEIVAALYP